MITIKQVEWLSVEAEEAAVTVSDGVFECVALAHPFRGVTGDTIRTPLHAVETSGAMRAEGDVRITRQNNPWGHEIIGVVGEDGLVRVGGIEIAGVRLPGDVRPGDQLEFVVSRFEL